MSQTIWEADKMLDVYIYDYLMKRKLHASAKAFQEEGKISTDPVAIDAPGGFLFEWWSVFWDIFIARTNEKHSEAAASFIETQMIKAREQQQQKPQQPQEMSLNQQAQMQQLLLQRQAQQHQQQQHQHQQQQQQQQQRRDGGQLLNGAANALVGGNDMLMRQNPAAASALAAKMYEERFKLPLQKDAFDDAAAMKQRIVENAGQILDPNQVSLLKATALGGQPPGHMLHGTPGNISANIHLARNRTQQLPSVPVSTQDTKGEMMNSKAAVPEGSLIGISGPNQASNNLTLKGWPLQALDRYRPGLLPQSNPLMQSSQPLNQLQQQLLLQAQQNLGSPSANDLESRKLNMLLNRNLSFGKDGQLNSVGDVSNVGSPVQVGSPVLPRADPDMLLKQQQMQSNSQQRQQYLQQHPLSSQTTQSSTLQTRQQDKVIGAGSVTGDGGSMSSSFQGNDQASKGQIGRKRKQPVSSSGPANSSGTANTTGPSPSSPSTPSTHTPGDAISMPTLTHNGGSSKSLLVFGSDGMGPLTTGPSQLGDIDRFVDDGSLEDNVESFLSDDADPRDRVSRCADVSKGFSFKEARVISASTSKIECCHFSPDGKLLATGGHDRKATLWCTDSFTVKSTLEEHSQWITDVRFSPNALRLATSSADRTVRVWDADNPGYSIRNFTGHSTTVMSLDFHPSKEDLLCSCDNNSEIRYWGVKNGGCAGVCKGGATQVRFQPTFGKILAAAADNSVSLLDVETHVCRLKLQGHKNTVHSVCWDSSGEYLASVSDDLVRVWSVGSGNKGEYIHELKGNGNKFHTCVFHPSYPILVVGCYETLEIWNMAENKKMTVRAHDKLVSSLAVSKVSGLIASASHDKCVKLWQ